MIKTKKIKRQTSSQMKVNAHGISIFWSRYEWNPFAWVNKWFCPIHRHDVCFRIKIAHRGKCQTRHKIHVSWTTHSHTHIALFWYQIDAQPLRSSSVLLFLSTFNCEQNVCSRLNRAKQQTLIVAFINETAQCKRRQGNTIEIAHILQ